MSLKTKCGNVAVLGSLLFSNVGHVVFLSGKTRAFSEQCVLGRGGIEVKLKQKKKKKKEQESIKNAILYLKVFAFFFFPSSLQFCVYIILNTLIINKSLHLSTAHCMSCSHNIFVKKLHLY